MQKGGRRRLPGGLPQGAARAHHWATACSTSPLSPPSLPSTTEIGVGLTGFGVLFTVLGVMFFFDKGLLAMGNVRGAGRERERESGEEGAGPRPSSIPPLIAHRPMPAFPPSQILFLSGVALTIGPRSTLRFFTRRRNARGSAFFGGGLLLVLAGWAVVGMAVEAYGFWLLFAGFFPTVLGFLRRAPGLGPVLDLPVLKTVR